MSWFKGIPARLRLLLASRTADERMDEEFRFHIDMETERLVREEGLERTEARRRALVAFGGVERYRQELRDGRGLTWLSGLSLDLKLGFRMLVKYPVLTAASILALAVAVTLAASWFEFMTDLAYPRLPLPDGDRIVSLRNHDLAVADRDFSSEPRSLHDFERWREELETIEHLTAGSSVEYSVTTEDGRFVTLSGRRVTPSMFRLARVRPLLGRTLAEEDDDASAPLVAVLGFAAWQRLFDGDRSAVGRTIRLGSEHATVVGVMPEGFAFPVNDEIWTPLRERALNFPPREGPRIAMVGRLAPGASLTEARAELEVLGRRAAAEFPATHEHLRPEARRFGRGNDMATVVTALNVPFLLFLLVVSANVATLLFARTAERDGEIALRSALGASRRRILLQLVAEALVLTSLAALLGLAAAHWGLGWGMELFWEVQQTRPPFWFDAGLSAPTILYAGALALLGALLIGGIPGIRATRRGLRQRLPQPGAGGAGIRFGALATGVIVVQVALCVAFFPLAILNVQELLPDRQASDFPAEAYLTGRLAADSGSAKLFDEAQHRLEAEPGVLAVTRASRLPGFNHPVIAVGIEDDSARVIWARMLAVDPDFFEVMGARLVAGRSFRTVDATATVGAVIADRKWAEATYGGQNPIGRRIRYPTGRDEEPGPWYEIVGVVAGMERVIGPGTEVALFRPLDPSQHAAVQLYLRTAAPPESLVPRVHDLAMSLDPGLGIVDLQPLIEVWRPVQRSDAFFAVALGVVAAIILLFALMGIYALTSFTVARRAREIGIRSALGADSRRIVVSIFSRAAGQIGVGILLGAALASLAVARSPEGLRLVAGVAAAMGAVGLLGCVMPARRALRIQPTEALRAE